MFDLQQEAEDVAMRDYEVKATLAKDTAWLTFRVQATNFSDAFDEAQDWIGEHAPTADIWYISELQEGDED